MSMNDLFNTLQSLDDELEKMESWIQDQATIIKPIPDKYHSMEQQLVSYENLGS